MQYKTLGLASIVIFGLLNCTAATAQEKEASHDGGCGSLSIMISNRSGHDCKLNYYTLNHGHLAAGSVPEATIGNGNSSYPFIVSQEYHKVTSTLFGLGPSITVQYACGNQYISLTSQQNHCDIFGGAGTIHATVDQESPEITATYKEKTGSLWWDKHGTLSWTLIHND